MGLFIRYTGNEDESLTQPMKYKTLRFRSLTLKALSRKVKYCYGRSIHLLKERSGEISKIMDIRKWTDEELASTREKLDEWCQKHGSKGWGNRLWLLTALLGAFAISTGVVFIFFDGITAMSIVLIVLGTITCFTWYKSEKQRKLNIDFLEQLKVEITRRAKRKEKNQ